MFNAEIQQIDDKQARHNFVIYTDTLYEAEIYIRGLLQRMYGSSNIVLEYDHDLQYQFYYDELHVGSVTITLGEKD